MSWTLKLNNEQFSFSAEDLPALVHGEKQSGASFLTRHLISELYQQGEPLVIVARDNSIAEKLQEVIASLSPLTTLTSPEEITAAESDQILYLTDELLLPHLLSSLSDIQERIIVIYGFENFSQQTITAMTGHSKTIFFGDLNTSSAKEILLQWKYNAKIFFSPLHNDFRLTLPPLEKYHGYFQGRISQGSLYLAQQS